MSSPRLNYLQAFLANPRRAALSALLIYLLFNLLLPLAPLPPRNLGVSVMGSLVLLSTAIFMFLQVWLAQAVVNLQPRPIIAALLVVCFTLLWFLTVRFVPPWYHRSLLMGLTITLGCAFLGILLAPIIREPNVLLPVALVAMPISG